MKTLGSRIKARRIALGLSQYSLGRRVGVSPSQISDWECDRTKGINSRKVARLAVALAVTADALLGLAAGRK